LQATVTDAFSLTDVAQNIFFLDALQVPLGAHPLKKTHQTVHDFPVSRHQISMPRAIPSRTSSFLSFDVVSPHIAASN
jgi:hypothetical protein